MARIFISLALGITVALIVYVFYPSLTKYIDGLLSDKRGSTKNETTNRVGDVVNGNKVVNNYNSLPDTTMSVPKAKGSPKKKIVQKRKSTITPINNNGNLSIGQQGGTVIQNTFGRVEIPDRHINAADIERLSTIPKSSRVIVNCYDPEETYDFSQEIINQLKKMGYGNVGFRRTSSTPKRVKERFLLVTDDYDASAVVVDVKPNN